MLSRTKQVDDAVVEHYTHIAEYVGYDISKIVRVPQGVFEEVPFIGDTDPDPSSSSDGDGGSATPKTNDSTSGSAEDTTGEG